MASFVCFLTHQEHHHCIPALRIDILALLRQDPDADIWCGDSSPRILAHTFCQRLTFNLFCVLLQEKTYFHPLAIKKTTDSTLSSEQN